MPEKPNIVLVHGAWADGSCWDAVIRDLQGKGYKVTAPQFPETSTEADVARLLQDKDARVRVAAAQVLEGFDAAGKPQLRPIKRPVTLRHLLTHTAGYTYDIWNENTGRYEKQANLPGLITCIRAASAKRFRAASSIQRQRQRYRIAPFRPDIPEAGFL